VREPFMDLCAAAAEAPAATTANELERTGSMKT